MLLYQILAFTMHGQNIEQSYKNNKFKISTPTWSDKFEVSDASDSLSDTQDYFEDI